VESLGFVNLTPFAAQPLLLSDERGADVLTFVVRATYALQPLQVGAPLTVEEEQAPVCLAPEYTGKPESSSVRYDSDAVVAKLATDVVLIGQAHAPHARATHADVSLAVGPVRSVVRVFGDRIWTKTLGRWSASAPEPFEAIPLVYERAFGGWDRSNPDVAKHEYEARNPVGVGFVSKKHGKVQEGTRLPNLEQPRDLIGSPNDRPAPAGFGFIGPHWQPRVALAGTYDDQWKARRMPLLPEDFDRRFYNAAHPALTAGGFLRGGEPVEIANASPRGTLRFQLPQVRPLATVRMKDGATHRVDMALDTVIVNTDEDKLFLVWRGSLPIHKRIHDVLWAKAQPAGNGGVGR